MWAEFHGKLIFTTFLRNPVEIVPTVLSRRTRCSVTHHLLHQLDHSFIHRFPSNLGDTVSFILIYNMELTNQRTHWTKQDEQVWLTDSRKSYHPPTHHLRLTDSFYVLVRGTNWLRNSGRMNSHPSIHPAIQPSIRGRASDVRCASKMVGGAQRQERDVEQLHYASARKAKVNFVCEIALNGACPLAFTRCCRYLRLLQGWSSGMDRTVLSINHLLIEISTASFVFGSRERMYVEQICRHHVLLCPCQMINWRQQETVQAFFEMLVSRTVTCTYHGRAFCLVGLWWSAKARGSRLLHSRPWWWLWLLWRWT